MDAQQHTQTWELHAFTNSGVKAFHCTWSKRAFTHRIVLLLSSFHLCPPASSCSSMPSIKLKLTDYCLRYWEKCSLAQFLSSPRVQPLPRTLWRDVGLIQKKRDKKHLRKSSLHERLEFIKENINKGRKVEALLSAAQSRWRPLGSFGFSGIGWSSVPPFSSFLYWLDPVQGLRELMYCEPMKAKMTK